MTFFGKNLKKIRKLRGLTQQDFATLFDLKRAALGAYEEGRSEPKINTLLRIANYFGISIEDLLSTELTVNQLLKFKGDFKPNSPAKFQDVFKEIPCVTSPMMDQFAIAYHQVGFIDQLPKFRIPIHEPAEFLAFEISSIDMRAAGCNFGPKDIVIGITTDLNQLDAVRQGTLVVAIVDNSVIFRRIYPEQGQWCFRSDHLRLQDLIFSTEKIAAIWQIQYAFMQLEERSSVQKRLSKLETEVENLKNQCK